MVFFWFGNLCTHLYSSPFNIGQKILIDSDEANWSEFDSNLVLNTEELSADDIGGAKPGFDWAGIYL